MQNLRPLKTVIRYSTCLERSLTIPSSNCLTSTADHRSYLFARVKLVFFTASSPFPIFFLSVNLFFPRWVTNPLRFNVVYGTEWLCLGNETFPTKPFYIGLQWRIEWENVTYNLADSSSFCCIHFHYHQMWFDAEICYWRSRKEGRLLRKEQ